MAIKTSIKVNARGREAILRTGGVENFDLNEKTSNIQHPTSNIQKRARQVLIGRWVLDVGCWMFINFISPPSPLQSCPPAIAAGKTGRSFWK
jgi:hypothetical protein